MPSRRKLIIAWLCFGVLGTALAVSIVRLVLRSRTVEAAARTGCRDQARQAAGAIRERLEAMEQVSHRLTLELEQGQVRPQDLPARLPDELRAAPGSTWRLGALFQPFAAGQGEPRWNPFVERGPEGVRSFIAYDASSDYTKLPWYQKNLSEAGWNEPHRDHVTGEFLVDYAEPFRLPGSGVPSGVVRVAVSLKEIQSLVGSLAPGSSGYGFLLSAKGVFMADPLDAHVRNGDTFEGVARAMNDQGRLRIARAALAHQAGFAQSVSGVTGQATWIFLEPVPEAGWSLGTTIIKDELDLAPPDLNHVLAWLVTLATATLLVGLFLTLEHWRDGFGLAWAFSLTGSLVLAAGTGFLWHAAYTLHQGPRSHEVEVMSIPRREAFIKRYEKIGAGLKEVSSTFIPTGVFIQQMEISGDSQMKISGQVWERFPKDFPAEGRGVTFPEAVTCTFGHPLEKTSGHALIQVYPFQGVFHMQADSIVNYPFDRSSVRLRMWPRQYYDNVVLVPDLEAYTILVPISLPGIDKGIELSGWKLGQSHFSFLQETYNTNFGISDYAGQQDSPELAYVFTLRRNFTNPFIATFLPILVVVGLLYALVVTTVRTKELMSASGYSAMNLLRSVITLFFPVVVAQINLRNHILTEGLLYVEYYYFLVYLLILVTAMNSLAVLYWDHPAIQSGDNRLAKLAFWPLLTGAFYAISLLYLL